MMRMSREGLQYGERAKSAEEKQQELCQLSVDYTWCLFRLALGLLPKDCRSAWKKRFNSTFELEAAWWFRSTDSLLNIALRRYKRSHPDSDDCFCRAKIMEEGYLWHVLGEVKPDLSGKTVRAVQSSFAYFTNGTVANENLEEELGQLRRMVIRLIPGRQREDLEKFRGELDRKVQHGDIRAIRQLVRASNRPTRLAA